MPLRLAIGTPILADPGTAEFAQMIDVDKIDYVPQDETSWCWAACFQMIRQHLGCPPLTQLDMAKAVCGEAACQDPEAATCNCGQWPEDVADACGLSCSAIRQPMQQPDFAAALGYGPVEIAFEKSPTENHVALVTSLHPDGTVRLLDPWKTYGISNPRFSDLATHYQAGAWIRTYSRFEAE